MHIKQIVCICQGKKKKKKKTAAADFFEAVGTRQIGGRVTWWNGGNGSFEISGV